jgi:hypothetical protein
MTGLNIPDKGSILEVKVLKIRQHPLQKAILNGKL